MKIAGTYHTYQRDLGMVAPVAPFLAQTSTQHNQWPLQEPKLEVPTIYIPSRGKPRQRLQERFRHGETVDPFHKKVLKSPQDFTVHF